MRAWPERAQAGPGGPWATLCRDPGYTRPVHPPLSPLVESGDQAGAGTHTEFRCRADILFLGVIENSEKY